MIQSMEIINFRGFKNVSLTSLPRFNVLIGGSGSGKTSFLEGLWMQGGISPEIFFRMRMFRGMADPLIQMSGDSRSYEAFFNEIFYDPSLEQGASIQLIDSILEERQLTISYGSSAQMVMDIAKPQPPSLNPGTASRPLVFRWKVRDKVHECPLKFVNNQMVVENPPEPFPIFFFASSLILSARETAERLSILNIEGETEKIIETIQKIYPHIRNLSSESIAGQQMIWASLRGLKRKIPSGIISSGINKLMNILLWISLNKSGTLLVDEIENGFYFEDYERVYRTIVEFCDAYDVQLFASTHSWEFLKAIAKVMEERQNDLAVLKTAFGNGSCRIKQMEGMPMVAAIEQEIDIRK